MHFRPRVFSLLLIIGLLTAACAGPAPGPTTSTSTQATNPFGKINHFIIIYQENWSFDSLFPNFPGADGIIDASTTSLQQVDKSGVPYTSLPQPLNSGKPDRRFPANLPV